jgi:hypothetical protein
MAEELLPPVPEKPALPPRKSLKALLLQTFSAGAFSGALVGLGLGVVYSFFASGAGVSERLENVLFTIIRFGVVGGSFGLLIGLIAWVIDRLFKRSA